MFDALFLEAHPRREVFWFLMSALVFAFGVSTVIEFILDWNGISTEGLGVFVMGGMAALLLHTAVKLHIILGWIAFMPAENDEQSDRASALGYLSALESASNSSNKTFEPQIKALAVILLAVTYIANSNEPDLAKALTLPFVEDHPLVVAALSVTLGTFFTNHRNVWYLLGGSGRLRRIVLIFANIRLGMVLGFIASALFAVACTTWASWLID